jgi:uncharacterized protein YbjT (DUF2867 family)
MAVREKCLAVDFVSWTVGIDEWTTHRILSRRSTSLRVPTLPTIARADVAHFMREELDNPGHVGQRVLPRH